MLTGILQPDAGVINICGYDYKKQMHLIRSKTGVCLQIDVLYDELTVREHVQYYASIKGVPLDVMEARVNEIIRKCGLVE
jgi:ABC-type multidrug transport system ATPase subunit